QPRAVAQAKGRSALAVRPGCLPGHRLEVRARLSRPAPMEPEQFRDQPAPRDRARQRGDPQSPVGEPLRHQRSDLGVWAADRRSGPGTARDPDIRRVLPGPRPRAGYRPARCAPITGPMYQLFIFFMITDHRTKVGSIRGRIDVAALGALVEAAI